MVSGFRVICFVLLVRVAVNSVGVDVVLVCCMVVIGSCYLYWLNCWFSVAVAAALCLVLVWLRGCGLFTDDCAGCYV